MASDTPTDAPRIGEPIAPAASVGTNRRRKPQPHHRPSSMVFGEVPSDPRVVIERCEADDPAAWLQLVGLLVGLLDTPPAPGETGRR